MLQQTQVKTVIPYWERWMRELPTIGALAHANSDRIHKLWEGLGYYSRVRNMQRAAQLIVENHHGQFPNSFDAILELPGIGRYTAGAICSIAFGQSTPILDGNVVRVLTRLFGIEENARDKQTIERLWDIAAKLVNCAAPDNTSALNQSLMELGALICTPRQPQCAYCPLTRNCHARRTEKVEVLPNLGPRVRATSRQFAAFVVKDNGKFLVRQRPARVVNAHLWEFPNVESGSSTSELRAAAQSALGFTPQTFAPICEIKHSITRYRISLHAFAVNSIKLPSQTAGNWMTRAQLEQLSFPSAHRKILEHL